MAKSRSKRRKISATRRRNSSRKREIGVDLIDELPTPILHRILDGMPLKYAARTALLSKKWQNLWNTFPYLLLEEARYERRASYACREVFVESLRLTSLNHDMMSLNELRIYALFPLDSDLQAVTDELVSAALAAGNIKNMELDFTPRKDIYRHTLYLVPDVIFSAGSSLVSLVLDGCRIETYVDTINLNSLNTLILFNVSMPEKMLSHLISACPLLESLSLGHCQGVKKIVVSNPKLKVLSVASCGYIQLLEIDAPNLQELSLRGQSVDNDITSLEILAFTESSAKSFKSLTIINLVHVRIVAEHFRLMIAHFQRIETMTFTKCVFQSQPRILCPTLQTLKIAGCYFPQQQDNTAPSLQIFHMSDNDGAISINNRMSFNCMKSFSLGGIELSDQLLSSMIAQMPMLETLELKHCTGCKHLVITSWSLKTFFLERCKHVEDADIDAPQLKHFKYVGPALLIRRATASTDLHAEIHLSYPSRRRSAPHYQDLPRNLMNSIQSFGQIGQLTLVSKHVELTIIPKNLSIHPVIDYLPELQVQTNMATIRYLDLLSGMLWTAVCHDSLSIDVGTSSLELKFWKFPRSKIDWSCPSTHDCVSQHLAEVRMYRLEGDDEEMELVKFLLGKAQLLTTMHISFKKIPVKQRSKLMTKINSFPRRSPAANLVFV